MRTFSPNFSVFKTLEPPEAFAKIETDDSLTAPCMLEETFRNLSAAWTGSAVQTISSRSNGRSHLFFRYMFFFIAFLSVWMGAYAPKIVVSCNRENIRQLRFFPHLEIRSTFVSITQIAVKVSNKLQTVLSAVKICAILKRNCEAV